MMGLMFGKADKIKKRTKILIFVRFFRMIDDGQSIKHYQNAFELRPNSPHPKMP